MPHYNQITIIVYIRIVSFNVSPFETLELEESENPTIFPPNLLIALSKLNLVRVEGSKNNVAITFPSSNFWVGSFSNSSVRSRILRISSVEKSSIDTKLLFFINMALKCTCICLVSNLVKNYLNID